MLYNMNAQCTKSKILFLQFNVSPGRHPKPPKVQKTEEPEVYILSLAPFTPNPKICFENIKVGYSATRQLNITNPAETGVEVCLNILINLICISY